MDMQILENAWSNFDEETGVKINTLKQELNAISKKNSINDPETKKRVAETTLDLLSQTPRNSIMLMETCHLITECFGSYKYDETLNKIFAIILDLEMPAEISFESQDAAYNNADNLATELKKYIKQK